MIGNFALYIALRCASLVFPHVPTRAAYWIADALGSLAYILFPVPRRALLSNLSVVVGLSPRDPALRRLARRAFGNDARNWVDIARSAGLSTAALLRQVDRVEGWEHVEQAMRQGRGMILVPLHLGNYELVGQILIARGYRLTIPVERLRPARLFTFLMSIRTGKGFRAVPVDHAPRELVKALRAGEIVGIMGDRVSRGKGIRVIMFGRETALPRSAVSLARRTGAPLHVAFGARSGDGFVGHISDPVPMARSADPQADDRENAQRLADAMQPYIAAFPDQWLAFTPLWAMRPEEAATMERTGAAV
ncbi:MAG TPA: hypothetical protein VFB58_14850 [Chloroflexota bacterium]|nr:hypothetical protein [Chloroflexota bacterium]